MKFDLLVAASRGDALPQPLNTDAGSELLPLPRRRLACPVQFRTNVGTVAARKPPAFGDSTDP